MKKKRKIAIALCSLGLVLTTAMPFIFQATENIFTVKAEEIQPQVYNADFFSQANTYDATLTEMSVRGSTSGEKYNSVSYNMNAKRQNVAVSDDAPQVTFITHGLGGNATHWSNNSGNPDWDFAYSPGSIIDLLQQKTNCNIYWAHFTSMNDFDLIQINNYNYDSQVNIDNITNNTKHSIVIFEGYNPGQSNDYIYTQFNIMASKVVLDLQALDANNELPRVNLIGHSRGGLTNLQYALDHPDLVESIFSLGTPYLGSTSASIDEFILDGYFAGGPGEEDIVNPDIYLGYMNRWNNHYETLYKDINVYALGGYQSIDMLIYQIVYPSIEEYLGENVIEITAKSLLKALNVYLSVKLGLLTGTVPNVIKQEIASAVLDIIYQFIPVLKNNTSIINGITAVFDLLFDELQFNPQTLSYDLLNDGLVDLPSQLGRDGQSNNAYAGFTRDIKRFGIFGKYNLDNASVNNFRVTHNLEARDNTLLMYIVKRINMSYDKNGSPYLVIDVSTANSPNAVSIVGYVGKNITGTLSIPEIIYLDDGDGNDANNNKNVVSISAEAFANNMNGETGITGIVIPQTVKSIAAGAFYNNENLETINLNGTLISEIGRAAFMNCEGLASISLPSTVVSIGDNAFVNCTNLTSINIPANVTSIGDGAFAGCSSLTNITIPAGVTNIGAGIFAACNNLNISVNASNLNYSAQGNILYNKEKTKMISSGNIAANMTIPNTVTEVEESAFSGNSNLQRVDIYGIPVIGDFAFYDCENLDEVYFYSYTVPEIGAGAFSDNTFTVYVPYNKQSSYYTIFSGYTDNIDSIPITVTLKKDGVAYQTIDTYYGADISGVTEPYKEGYTFNYWVDSAGNTYQNGDVWDSTVDLTVEVDWTARQFHITFSGYGSENLDAKSVTYDQPIGTLPVISKTGNTFNGWKDEYGVYYTADTIWQRTSNLMLTSDFSPNEYTITYNGNGGTASIATQEVEYGTVVNSLATATKTGYTFTGWNMQADGFGETVSAPYTYEIANDITLYAQYTVNTYAATFNKQGGSGGSAGVNATYNEAMPSATAPTRTGYAFGGYYSQINGGGTQYYDEDMNSMHVWNYANAATLYAKWVANTYTVTLQVCYPGGANSSLTSQSSSDFKYINYTATESTTITIWTTHTSGDPYLVLYNENLSQLAYNDDGKGNLDSKITYSVTSGVTYVIGFRGFGSNLTKGNVYISKDITVTYGSAMPTKAVPTQAGYTFEGYYAAQNGSGTKYYNSNMSSANNWNIAGSTTLYANWTAHVYTVILNKQSSALSGTDSVEVTYGAPMPSAEAPQIDNYIFQGYFAEPEGGGTQYYDGYMNSINNWDIAEDKTIYAYWIGNPYTVTFDKQGGSGGTSNITVHYGTDMPAAIAPTRTNYVLVGYFDQPNGAGAKYYDGPNMVSVKDWDKTSNTTLYAYWRGSYYSISYQNLTFMNQTARVIWDNRQSQLAPTNYEYGVGLDLTRASGSWSTSSAYDPCLVFLGWYTDMTFQTQVTSISSTQTGTVTVYAKWRYDYTQTGRMSSLTVTDDGPYSNSYDSIYIGLTSNGLYDELNRIGIKYLTIQFRISIREVNDGYQEIFLYNGSTSTSTCLWSKTNIEHGPGTTNTTSAYYIYTVELNLSALSNNSRIYVRYSAHGSGEDTWVTANIYFNIMYTACSGDYDDKDFTWAYPN